MTTTLQATDSQLMFLKTLMYERLDMSIEEIDAQDFSKFGRQEASDLITEWTAMPQLRKTPNGLYTMPSRVSPPSPSEARAKLLANAMNKPSTVPGGHQYNTPTERTYDCFNCPETGIVGRPALDAHKLVCPKTGRNGQRAAAPASPSVAAQRPASVPSVPMPAKGRYAILNDNGTWDFYRVTERKGRFGGTPYLVMMRQSGDPYLFLNRSAATEIYTLINANPKDAMRQYGIQLGHCGKCGKSLTDPESRRRGIGPDCWSRF